MQNFLLKDLVSTLIQYFDSANLDKVLENRNLTIEDSLKSK